MKYTITYLIFLQKPPIPLYPHILPIGQSRNRQSAIGWDDILNLKAHMTIIAFYNTYTKWKFQHGNLYFFYWSEQMHTFVLSFNNSCDLFVPQLNTRITKESTLELLVPCRLTIIFTNKWWATIQNHPPPSFTCSPFLV